jgi:hypothetical protein
MLKAMPLLRLLRAVYTACQAAATVLLCSRLACAASLLCLAPAAAADVLQFLQSCLGFCHCCNPC